MEIRKFLNVSDDDDGGDHDDDVGGDEDDDVGVEDVLHLGCNSHSFVEGILGWKKGALPGPVRKNRRSGEK